MNHATVYRPVYAAPGEFADHRADRRGLRRRIVVLDECPCASHSRLGPGRARLSAAHFDWCDYRRRRDYVGDRLHGAWGWVRSFISRRAREWCVSRTTHAPKDD